MAAGRKLVIRRGGTQIAAIRSKTISINGEAIDITSGDDQGFRLLDADVGERSIDISFDGVTKDAALRDIMLSTSGSLLLDNVDVLFPNGDSLACDFFFSSLEETGSYKDAVTFSGSMQSSGQWTLTKA